MVWSAWVRSLLEVFGLHDFLCPRGCSAQTFVLYTFGLFAFNRNVCKYVLLAHGQ